MACIKKRDGRTHEITHKPKAICPLNFFEFVGIKKGFRAMKCIDHFINIYNGCLQITFVRLHKSLVLPTMDY